MKKLLFLGSVAILFLPALAFAAYNDVSLTTDADISVGGVTINVSESTASLETLVVNESNFVITLRAGSSFTASVPTLERLIYDITQADGHPAQVEIVCTGSSSSLTVTATGETTLTVTPGGVCADVVEAAGRTSKGDARGRGTSVATTNPVAVVATTATKEAQINAIMQAIAALQAQIQAMTGAPASQVSAIAGKITISLSSGSRGASVKTLQQFLNTHGFEVATSGPGAPGQETDFFGRLTEEAVKKFQVQYGIASQGTPGYGFVGPKTRAKISELSGN